VSAGILLYRRSKSRLEVLLAHPGGPFFARKDAGHWTIPKGEVDPGEDLLDVARREFEEETGHAVPPGALIDLGSIVQKGGKVVHAWAVEGELDPGAAVSNTFDLEWPPRSGRVQAFPEVDRVKWFTANEARMRIRDTQAPLVDRLEASLRPG
jgi:predicted NUDIX family NTP pyrophosphohydrolase